MMDGATVLDGVSIWWSNLSYCELFGNITLLACVWLYGKENLWAWPVALVNCVLFFAMFAGAKLYSDAVLQAVFFVLTVVGWYQWLYGGPKKTDLKVTRGIGLAHFVALLLIAAGIQGGAGYYFAHYTDAAIPYCDSLILALSLVAQWLLNRKQIENWVLWMIVNVLTVGVCSVRGLYLTAAVYAVLFFLAARGYIRWKRTIEKAGEALPA